MTFGEYLHKLIKDKHINLSNLAANAGIKSKNEIYRLFDNKYSYEKTKKLTDQILSVIEIHTVSNEYEEKLNVMICENDYFLNDIVIIPFEEVSTESFDIYYTAYSQSDELIIDDKQFYALFEENNQYKITDIDFGNCCRIQLTDENGIVLADIIKNVVDESLQTPKITIVVSAIGVMSGVQVSDYILDFQPKGTYTREQAMVTFYRLYNQLTRPETLQEKFPDKRDLYTLDTVPKIKINGLDANFGNYHGMYIDNYSVLEKNDKSFDVSFDVYNTAYIYGIVEVYDKNDNWIDAVPVKKMSDKRRFFSLLYN